MSQMRSDLLERIKERHDLWFTDSMELYKMGRLKPSAFANDVITVLTHNIIWLLDCHETDLDAFVDGLRKAAKHYRKKGMQ